MLKQNPGLLLFCTLLPLIFSCKNDTIMDTEAEIPLVYSKIYGATDMYIDGDFIVITSNDMPDHPSPYYLGTQWEAELYEAYNGTNASFVQNPNVIGEQNFTFRLPLHPEEATTHTSTPLGPMGIALNGVSFFNQYAAGYSPLDDEINSMDQYNGHPAQTSEYHYHIEPLWLTQNNGEESLLGFLLDGFPVYGPIENGVTITNADLDDYHGHFGVTTDFPDGTYHYHITAADPYINGDGFYGTPGTITK